ncbi:hypothetical protein IJX73_02275 [bacterium]|nr:hypothetical protein [bacterium]MBQ9149735.1 hypothetical protein [bacterium]
MNKIQNFNTINKVSFGQKKAQKNTKINSKVAKNTVSFTSKPKNQTGIFSKIASFFGVSKPSAIDEKQTTKQVHPAWLNANGVTLEDYDSPLARNLRLMRRPSNNPLQEGASIPIYGEEAIKVIVKNNKENPEFASELTKYLKNSQNVMESDAESIAKHLKETPDVVREFYDASSESASDLALMLNAYDVNPRFTNQIFNLTNQDGARKYHPSDIYRMVTESKQLGEASILKYADDSRMTLYSSDVVAFAKADKTCAAKIDEMLNVIADSGMQEKVGQTPIYKVFESYLQDSKGTSELIKNGAFAEVLIPDGIATYKEAPEQMLMILAKNAREKDGYQIRDIATYAKKAKLYDEQIKKLVGDKFDDLSSLQLKKLIDAIEGSIEDVAKALKNIL